MGAAAYLLTVLLGAISVYAVARCTYLLYFHPLSRFPGPRIAAISNIWYAYHWLSGRYPWATERVLKQYGDVVRIAPNELLFMTPQAFADIYTPHVKNMETFVKTDFNDRGDEHGGIAFERDPVRHRNVAKKVTPAFGPRAITAKEPKMHKYIDLFIEKMKECGGTSQGVDLAVWCNWLAMDISADITYNHEMNQLANMKNSVYMDVLLGFNKYTTIQQVSLRFPSIKWIKLLFLPFAQIPTMREMVRIGRAEVQKRLCQAPNPEQQLDFFEQLMPTDGVIPQDPKEMRHLEQLTMQLLFGSFEPVAGWFYGTLMCLLATPESHDVLVREIRDRFRSYQDIKASELASLPYLNACLEESLRLFPNNNLGLPRISPGAKVDGVYVPKGVYCQTSMFATSRSPRYFHDPLRFRPQRYLPADHPLYDPAFSQDATKEFHPFSLGPRACLGKEVAWRATRLFVAKVLWTFDLTPGSGKALDFEKDFLTYGFWVKPELRARFVERETI